MKRQIEQLLHKLQAGEMSSDAVVDALSELSVEPLGSHARLDHLREERVGAPEIVYGQGKEASHIAEIMERLDAQGNGALATRVSNEKAELVLKTLGRGIHHKRARCIELPPSKARTAGLGKIAVVCAGTSDLPVAEEAEVALRFLGQELLCIRDVGVSALQRLFSVLEELRECQVIIAVAGMEGALPTVMAGLVDRPIIAVPASVGYGVSQGGYAALAGMLSSCAPGLCVVNIDNGLGAAMAALRINRPPRKKV